jgi:hypothetical protein
MTDLLSWAIIYPAKGQLRVSKLWPLLDARLNPKASCETPVSRRFERGIAL